MVITAGDLLKQKGPELWTISPDASVYEALQLLSDKNIGALPVVEAEKMVGIFSERDYARKIVLKGKFSRNTPVREIMTGQVISVTPEHKIEQCMDLMTSRRIRHLPVMEGDQVLGIVSIGDIVKAIISDQQSTISLLNDYIIGGR